MEFKGTLRLVVLHSRFGTALAEAAAVFVCAILYPAVKSTGVFVSVNQRTFIIMLCVYVCSFPCLSLVF